MAARPLAPIPSVTVFPGKPRRSRKWVWLIAIVGAVLIVAAVCVRIAIMRAEPILRARVIQTLSARFKSPVELAEFHVWIADGLNAEGKGLKIFGPTDPNPTLSGVQPLLEIQGFRFQTALRNLFRDPMHVDTIFVNGLTLNIPPKSARQEIKNLRRRGGKMTIAVARFVCSDAKLVINTDVPGKRPLEFAISDLRLRDIGPGQPFHFDALLINPKPVGNILSTGLFGPLNETSPRNSVVEGEYSFTHADLSTLKGLGGILSSTGQYSGRLGRIEINGQTDTPDFRLTISGHPVPLHTDFHAIVDGTDGDTYLDPVRARVFDSSFTAKGKIVRTSNPHGHDIELAVVLGRSDIEDLLKLGVKTNPPIMTGRIEMTTQLSLQPGPSDISERLHLSGKFHIPDAHFESDKLQTRIDALSLRGLGKPQLLQDAADIVVPADIQGRFKLDNGVLSFSFLHFQVPGSHADLTGRYTLDGRTFDFHGTLKMDAKLSHMTTGWKSILLKPVDPFFRKDGVSTEIPFKISGTKSEPHFGLDLFH